MTDRFSQTTVVPGRAICSVVAGVLGCCLALFACGCSAFNPAFLNVIAGDGAAAAATIPNPPGHVIVTLVNNAEVAEQVITCLESDNCGCREEEQCGALQLTDAEKRALKPRIRLRVRVTFRDGTSQLIEYVDGSKDLVKPNFNATALPDLNQNDLNTVVTICEVASVEVVAPIEVFVPIVWSRFELVDPTDNVAGFTRTAGQLLPQFVTLQVDDVDEDLNTLVRRNIGLRDAPATVTNPLCGAVVAITINGALSVPFFEGRPGFNQDDEEQGASVGGRYEFSVSVQ